MKRIFILMLLTLGLITSCVSVGVSAGPRGVHGGIGIGF